MRFAVLLCLLTGLAGAETWSGALVNAKCYAAKERNTSPGNQDYNVNRDRSQEISYCSPGAKTKTFAVVTQDGDTLNLDPGGNSKASELVRTATQKAPMVVRVSGERNGNTVKVESIALTAQDAAR